MILRFLVIRQWSVACGGRLTTQVLAVFFSVVTNILCGMSLSPAFCTGTHTHTSWAQLTCTKRILELLNLGHDSWTETAAVRILMHNIRTMKTYIPAFMERQQMVPSLLNVHRIVTQASDKTSDYIQKCCLNLYCRLKYTIKTACTWKSAASCFSNTSCLLAKLSILSLHDYSAWHVCLWHWEQAVKDVVYDTGVEQQTYRAIWKFGMYTVVQFLQGDSHLALFPTQPACQIFGISLTCAFKARLWKHVQTSHVNVILASVDPEWLMMSSTPVTAWQTKHVDVLSCFVMKPALVYQEPTLTIQKTMMTKQKHVIIGVGIHRTKINTSIQNAWDQSVKS